MVLPFAGITDATAERANRGWRRFLAINYGAGFGVTMLAIVAVGAVFVCRRRVLQNGSSGHQMLQCGRSGCSGSSRVPARSRSGTTPGRRAVEATTERIRIELGGALVAETKDAVRVLETSHPPVYYLPLEAFAVSRPRGRRPQHVRVQGRWRTTSPSRPATASR